MSTMTEATAPSDDAQPAHPVEPKADAMAETAAETTAEAKADAPADKPADTPAANAANTAPDASPAATGARLAELFPGLFKGAAKPLKLRIQADIQERAPGVFSKQALSAFLRRHTGATSYLVAVSKGSQRFDLDGQPAGELSDEHRKVAADELARRRKLRQERDEADQQARRFRAQLLRDHERSRLTEANFCALKGIALEDLPALLAQARTEAAEEPPRPPRDRGHSHGQGRPEHGRGGPRRDGAPSHGRPPRQGEARGDGQGRPRSAQGQGPAGDRPRAPKPKSN